MLHRWHSRSTRLEYLTCLRQWRYGSQTCSRSVSILNTKFQRHELYNTAINTHRRRAFRKPSTTSIVKSIQDAGGLPELPSEPVIRLPPLPSQRQTRHQNIVKHDLGATIQAHRIANDMARGFVRLNMAGEAARRLPHPTAITRSEAQKEPEGRIQYQKEEHGNKVKKSRDSTEGQVKTSWQTNDSSPITSTPDLLSKLDELDHADAFSRLNAEIRTFEDWMRVEGDEHQAGLEIFEDFRTAISKIDSLFELELYGSRTTDLAMPLSDIDIRLGVPGVENRQNERGPSSSRPQIMKLYRNALHKVKSILAKAHGHKYDIGSVRPGRVPLLEIREKRTGLIIQLVAIGDRRGERNREFSKFYQSEYPQLRPLFILLRWWTTRIGLDDASMGGISSYLTFNLILTSITHSKELYSSQELGKQLIHFLEFWSSAHVGTTGYAPDPARTFPKFASNIVEEDLPDSEDVSGFTSSPIGEIHGETHVRTVVNDSASGHRPLPLKPEEKYSGSSSNQDESKEDSDAYLEGIKALTTRARSLQRQKSSRDSVVLILQDPADPQNNLGASASRFVAFQKIMKDTLNQLKGDMKVWDTRGQKTASSELKTDLPRKLYLLGSLLYAREPGNKRQDDLESHLGKLERSRQRILSKYLRRAERG